MKSGLIGQKERETTLRLHQSEDEYYNEEEEEEETKKDRCNDECREEEEEDLTALLVSFEWSSERRR